MSFSFVQFVLWILLGAGLMAFVSGGRRYAWAGEAALPGRRARPQGQPTLSQPGDDTLY